MNTLLRCFVALVLASSLGACYPRFRVDQLSDDFRQQQGAMMKSNMLPSPDAATGWLELNAEVVSHVRVASCSLRVVYYDLHRWLEIPRGQTLLILADTDVIRLTGRGSRGRRGTTWLGGARKETASYGLSADQLTLIASAQRVRVRLLGKHEYVERTFSDQNIRRFKNLMDSTVVRRN